MTGVVEVDGWRLTMPKDWWVWKYDDSAFHRNQFQKFAGGSKAMWLIELKDYRRNRRTKPGSVFAEVAAKVRATLAGLATARTRANDAMERDRAHQSTACRQIRIALQLSQSVHPSRLFRQVLDPADAQTQLRREMRAVDPHALCVVGAMDAPVLPWATVAIPSGKRDG